MDVDVMSLVDAVPICRSGFPPTPVEFAAYQTTIYVRGMLERDTAGFVARIEIEDGTIYRVEVRTPRPSLGGGRRRRRRRRRHGAGIVLWGAGTDFLGGNAECLT